jgi:hypothetical protein
MVAATVVASSHFNACIIDSWALAGLALGRARFRRQSSANTFASSRRSFAMAAAAGVAGGGSDSAATPQMV